LNYRGKFREIITSAKTAFNAITAAASMKLRILNRSR